MNKKILVIVAHPDDEALGMGGTILKHKSAGDEINILFLGDGASSRGINSAEMKKRAVQAAAAAEALGVKNIFLEKLPDNKFDTAPLLDIVKKIEKVLAKIRPAVIYTHFSSDLNIDHQITFKAVLTACLPQPKFCFKKIYSFEVLSSTEWQIKDQAHCFCPTEYVDISEFIEKKIKILKQVYGNELRPYPHPRSKEGVKILARYRGLEVGCKFAEAFCQIRNIR